MGQAGGLAPGRFEAIDAVKAAAIVAVVFTHARSEFAPSIRSWQFWLCASWTPFQVPAFLFASGFLYARSEPESFARVRERWLRVLAPYLVASGVAYLVGVARASSVSDFAFQLATGSTLGVYYYVFLIAVVSPVAWPLSRMGRVGPTALLAVCIVAMGALAAHGGGGPVGGWFWSLRNPLDHFWLGYFVAGWLTRLALPEFLRAAARRPRGRRLALATGLAAGPLGATGLLPGELGVPLRVAYTLAMVGALAALAQRRRPGGAVLFLSQASLAIYLYHRIFQRLVEARLGGWPEPAGTLALVGVGLGGAVALALLGRRWLGVERSRFWLGA